jgi:hypothetical protein
MMRSLAFVLALSAFIPTAGSAQATEQLRAGTRIRIDAPYGEYFVVDATSDSLVLRGKGGMNHRLAAHAVGRVRVEAPRSRGQAALGGFALWGMVGGAGGLVIGFASGDDPPGWFSSTAEEKALMGAVLMGGLSGITGALAGLVHPGSRWVDVSQAVNVGFKPGRTGRVALTYTVKF